jgi:polyisoprenyl-phosphate glycosyltransferase
MDPSSQSREKRLANQDLLISCIVPVLNEAALIKRFLEALQSQLHPISPRVEIIVIDDGSTDETSSLVEHLTSSQPSIKLLRFSRNFGKEQAIAAGLKYCRGDVAIIIDADFQHPLELIPTFLTKWTEGYDMVYGVRNDREDQSTLRRFFSRLFYKLLDTMTNVKIPANAGDFRLIDRSAINTLNQCEERTRFMKGLYAWIGYKSIAIPFHVANRPAGKSQHHYRRLTELALTGFISFSDVPLRIWGLVGLVISLISFLSALYIIIDTLIHGTSVPGYATLIVTVIFFGGIQLLSIGIVGEYIARIFHEVKRRPSYIIEKTISTDHEEGAE